MIIRKTTLADVNSAAEIYDEAKQFMRDMGNPKQWTPGYPGRESILADIEDGTSYVCEENGQLLAIFMFRIGEDETYKIIEGGEWLDDAPYAVIHRIAVSKDGRGRGVAGFVFSECFRKYPNLKIDTHEDNIPMQKALTRAGFKYCGTIYVLDHQARRAYQKNA